MKEEGGDSRILTPFVNTRRKRELVSMNACLRLVVLCTPLVCSPLWSRALKTENVLFEEQNRRGLFYIEQMPVHHVGLRSLLVHA